MIANDVVDNCFEALLLAARDALPAAEELVQKADDECSVKRVRGELVVELSVSPPQGAGDRIGVLLSVGPLRDRGAQQVPTQPPARFFWCSSGYSLHDIYAEFVTVLGRVLRRVDVWTDDQQRGVLQSFAIAMQRLAEEAEGAED